MPDPLAERIQAWQKDLDAAQEAIHSQAVETVLAKNIQGGAALRRVRQDFDDRFLALNKRLAGYSSKTSSQTTWTGLENDRKDCSTLLLQCLAFVQGVLLRDHSTIGRICSIADNFMAELNAASRLPWNSFTLPADGESFESLAEIIRVRFPAADIWDLPITAHEFGHYAARTLKAKPEQTTEFPDFQSYLQQKTTGAVGSELLRKRNYLNEFFADVFGTYSLGPAFVLTCLHLRFSPGSADQETDDHPSFVSRAYLILKVLKRMEKNCPQYVTVGEIAQNDWRSAVEAAGKQMMEKNEELDDTAKDLYRFLTEVAPHAEYKRWANARTVSADLSSNRSPDSDTTLADILNAAWIDRLRPGTSAQKVSEDAMRLCERVSAQPVAMRSMN